MSHTAVVSVSVWGIPPSIFKLKVNLTCLASSRGRQNGSLGHTGIGNSAVCPNFVNVLRRCEHYRLRYENIHFINDLM
jgi:hypothetical protein